VSTMTVYRLIKAGRLHAVRVGRSYRVRCRAVEAFVEVQDTRLGRSRFADY